MEKEKDNSMRKPPFGLRVKIKIEDPETGNLVDKTVYFSSMAKCKELVGLKKKHGRLLLEAFKLAKELDLIQNEYGLCEDKNLLDGLFKELEIATEKMQENDDAQNEVLGKFLKTGFKSAGYTQKEAEDLIYYLPAERIQELVEISKIGGGSLDFTRE